MKLFIIKSIILFLISATIFSAISSTYKESYDIDNDYMAAIIDKHERLGNISTRRIILVGGSNLAFGINSESIQKKLEISVVNLGLHAGLGLDFMLNEASSIVKKNDIIILSIEYPLFDISSYADRELVNHTIAIYPEAASYIKSTFNEFLKKEYKNFKRVFHKKEKIKIDSLYNRKSFNQFGDIIAHLKRRNSISFSGESKMSPIRLNSKVLISFYNKCCEVGAIVCISFPPYPESEYEKNKYVIKNLENQISTKLSFLPRLDSPERLVLNDSCFYNTVYHLNAIGRERRSEILIKELQGFLPQN
jgi:hypothetical protein